MSRISRAIASVAASALVLGGGVLGTHVVQAEENAPAGNYVSFGDSIASNPTVLDVVAARVKGTHPELQLPIQTDAVAGCAHGEDNVGKRVAAKTGLELSDYSCPGATAYTPPSPQDPIPHNQFSQQVDQALNDGALTPDTKLVSIIIGVNDTYQKSNLGRPQQERLDLYHNEVGAQVDRIREAAPNATVVMVGYPDETDGGNYTCATNLLGQTSHWYFPAVRYFQEELRTQQRGVAEEKGLPYIDMVSEINIEKNNSGCLNIDPGQRFNAAIFDDGGLHNLAGHLTGPGNEYYAERISSFYQH